MKKILIFVLVVISLTLKSQPMKLVKSKFEAKYLVYFTNNYKKANVIAYRVDNYWECTKPGYIYLAPVFFKKATPIFEVADPNKADLIIFWTKDKSKVKWLN